MNLRSQKGINMITLSIAVIILVIITSILVYNAKDETKIKALNNMYNDIEQLNNKVSSYYLEHGDIPKGDEYTDVAFIDSLDDTQKNPNNAGKFYVINLNALEGVSLNYGKKFDETTANEKDIYIINEVSHTIYYPRGIKVENITYYTEPDTWTEVDLSVIPIYTAEQLAKVGSGDTITIDGVDYTFSLDGTYVLKNDIDLSSVCSEESGISWTPIGNASNPFTGIFYGNGHEIKNIYINNEIWNSYLGLFGKVGNCCINHLGITGKIQTNAQATIGSIIGESNSDSNCKLEQCYSKAQLSSTLNNWTLGGIVGAAYGEISMIDCYNEGSVKGGTNTGGLIGYINNKAIIEKSYNVGKICSNDLATNYNTVGGILAIMESSDNVQIINCYNNGEIANEGTKGTGGIVGAQEGSEGTLTIKKCDNQKNVTGARHVGGIIGTLNSGTIENCDNTDKIEGTVINSSDGSVGGIVGWCDKDSITKKCKNEGIVIGKSNCIGGICGVNNGGTIEQCLNNGNIKSTKEASATGGITGYHREENSKTTNCYNREAVNGYDGTGGIIGNCAFGEVSNCYNIAIISGTYNIYSITNATSTNCYYLSTLPTTDTNATAVSESDMKLQSFVDLLNTGQSDAPWVMDTKGENNGYPILKWQTEE